MTQVRAHLYLAGSAAVNPENLASCAIAVIINVTSEVRKQACVPRGTLYYRFAINDTPRANLTGILQQGTDLIQRHVNECSSVLVHCQQGVSRSAALVLAYLIKFENMTLRQAYVFLRSKRSIVLPNRGFWEQLITFERSLRGSNSTHMQQRPSDLDRDDLQAPFTYDALYPDVVWDELRAVLAVRYSQPKDTNSAIEDVAPNVRSDRNRNCQFFVS